MVGDFLHTLSPLLPDGTIKKAFKLCNFGHLIGIFNTDMTCKSLEAFLEASLQIQLQLYAYFNGYDLGFVIIIAVYSITFKTINYIIK